MCNNESKLSKYQPLDLPIYLSIYVCVCVKYSYGLFHNYCSKYRETLIKSCLSTISSAKEP